MNTMMYASRFTQVYRRRDVTGTLELKTNLTSHYYVFRFAHVDKIKKMEQRKKHPPANITKTDEVVVKLQKKIQWNKSGEGRT